jgi:hypothetical protein
MKETTMTKAPIQSWTLINPEAAETWANELIATDKLQGKQFLMLDTKRGREHCCLGILAITCGVPDDTIYGKTALTFDGLPPMGDRTQEVFAYLNDHLKMTFEQIGKAIKAGLFDDIDNLADAYDYQGVKAKANLIEAKYQALDLD